MSNSRNSLDSLYTIFRAMIRQEIDQTPGFRELTSRSTLPASVDAERTILGAILLDSQSLHEARGKKLEAGDFSLDSHRRIFARMCTLSEAQHAIDLITVSEELDRNKELQAIGGPAYLSSLTEGLPRRLSIGEYIAIVHEKAKLRRIMAACLEAIKACQEQQETAADIVGQLGIALKGIRKMKKEGSL